MHRDDSQPDETPRRPEDPDWTEEAYPLCDADFVDETLDQVIRDRAEIAADAAHCDDAPFAPEELAAFAVPDPDPDFVAQTLRAVMIQQRADLRLRDDEEEVLSEVMQAQVCPEPRRDFVDATLSAVLADRQHRTVSLSLIRGGGFTRWASVAAILLCGVVYFWPRESEVPAAPGTSLLQAHNMSWTHSLPLAEPDLPPARRLGAQRGLQRFVQRLEESR